MDAAADGDSTADKDGADKEVGVDTDADAADNEAAIIAAKQEAAEREARRLQNKRKRKLPSGEMGMFVDNEAGSRLDVPDEVLLAEDVQNWFAAHLSGGQYTHTKDLVWQMHG